MDQTLDLRLQLEQDLLKRSDATNYRDALAHCPQLVRSECDPQRYLLFTNNNVEQSAQKIVNYWNTRKQVFGERWLLPLSMDPPDSALDEQTIAILNVGTVYLLPPNKDGHTIMYWLRDRVNFTPKKQEQMGIDFGRRQQIVFIMLHYISLQHNPTFVLANISLQRDPKSQPRLTASFANMVQSCFPLTLSAVHVLFKTTSKRSKYIAETFVPFFWKMIQGPLNFTRRTLDVVVEDEFKKERAAIAKVMVEKYGWETLPPGLGGTFGFDDFKEWMRNGRLDDTTNNNNNNDDPPNKEEEKEEEGALERLTNAVTDATIGERKLPLKKRSRRIASSEGVQQL